MTVKAAALVTSVSPEGSGPNMHLTVRVAGLATGNPVLTAIDLSNVSPTISAAFLEADIKQAVKDELTNNNGYSFGLLDTVRLIGALL